MAENVEKKALVTVELKASEALKKLADLRMQSDKLKKTQKELDKSTADGRLEFERLGQGIKAINSQANEYQKEVQSNIKYQREAEGSLQKLKAELSLNTAAYNKLSEAQKNTVEGSMLQRQITETTEKLKEQEEALGNHRRSVGDYEKAGRALREELRELTGELVNMRLAGEETSDMYKSKIARLTELKNAQQEVIKTAEALGNNTKQLMALKQSLAVASSAFSAYGAVLGSITNGADEHAEAIRRMQQALLVSNALIQLQSLAFDRNIVKQMAMAAVNKIKLASQILLNKENARATIILSANAKAETAKNVAMTKGNAIKRAAAVATWAWNKALAANPVLAIVVGILALIAAGAALYRMFRRTDAVKEAANAQREYEAQVERTRHTIARVNRAETRTHNERSNRMRREIMEMQRNGASAEEIANFRAKSERELTNIAIRASRERELAKRAELEAADEQIAAQRRVVAEQRTGTRQHKAEMEALNELIRSRNEHVHEINQEIQARTDLGLQAQEQDIRASEEQRQREQQNALASLERQKKLQDEQFRLRATFLTGDFAEQQRFEIDRFNSAQEYERRKLQMQLRFGRITQAEFDSQRKAMRLQEQTFQNEQINAQRDFLARQQRDILRAANKTTEMQIQAVEEQYRSMIASLASMEPPPMLVGQSQEDFENSSEFKEWQNLMYRRAELEYILEKQKQAEIEQINRDSLDRQIADIENALQREFENDLARFTDNQRERNRIEIEMLERQIAEKRAKNISAYEDEAQLRALNFRRIQLDYSRELLLSDGNARARYEAQKTFLEKQLEIFADNADKRLQIEVQLLENERMLMQARIETFDEWTNRTMGGLTAVSNLATALGQRELRQFKEADEFKRKSLQHRLETGAIDYEEYNRRIELADLELDEKRAEIAQKQAIREQLLRVFDIGINTASAVVKNMAVLGYPAAVPINILTLALGAVKAAAVLATPLPQASRGMLLQGASHAQGGIPIEAEGGEAIINKRSTAMFRPLLSAINEAGGGVKFAGGGLVGGGTARFLNDGGYTARQNERPQLTADDMQAAMTAAVQQTRVYATILDIRRANRQYMEIHSIRDSLGRFLGYLPELI